MHNSLPIIQRTEIQFFDPTFILSTPHMDFYTDYANFTILGNDENFQIRKGSAAGTEMKTKTNENVVNNETN